jgi:hypothetical protein
MSGVTSSPIRFGVIVYGEFEVLEVFSLIEVLNTVSERSQPPFAPDFATRLLVPFLPLSQSTLDPVHTKPARLSNKSVNTIHTFAVASVDMEVLIVPGGTGDIEKASKFATRGCYTWGI